MADECVKRCFRYLVLPKASEWLERKLDVVDHNEFYLNS